MFKLVFFWSAILFVLFDRFWVVYTNPLKKIILDIEKHGEAYKLICQKNSCHVYWDKEINQKNCKKQGRSYICYYFYDVV